MVEQQWWVILEQEASQRQQAYDLNGILSVSNCYGKLNLFYTVSDMLTSETLLNLRYQDRQHAQTHPPIHIRMGLETHNTVLVVCVSRFLYSDNTEPNQHHLAKLSAIISIASFFSSAADQKKKPKNWKKDEKNASKKSDMDCIMWKRATFI